MLASGCLFFFFFLSSPFLFDDTALRSWLTPGVSAVAPPPHCARAACQPAFGCFIYRWPSGPTQQARSVFASSYRIISRRTSWRRRSLAGGCSDCQKHLKSSNLQRILESVVIFMGNGENRWTVGWLSLACRSVWIFDIFFLWNHQYWRPWWTSKNFSRSLSESTGFLSCAHACPSIIAGQMHQ